MPKKIQTLSSFQDISSRYPCIFCDIWGVLHNGETPYRMAGDMLAEYRKNGGFVILISNAPRHRDFVVAHLEKLGVRSDVFDAVATSGDLAEKEVEARQDQKMFFIGLKHDIPSLDAANIQHVSVEEADYIFCTGFRDDEIENVETYRSVLETAYARRLPFICANPDLVVERGVKIIPCAGSIALAYEQMGGDVFWAGKPYTPIYEMAKQLAEEKLGKTLAQKDMLAIGDAIRTDIAGAINFGIDSLMVTSGIHGGIFKNDAAFVTKWLAEQPVQPTFLLSVAE